MQAGVRSGISLSTVSGDAVLDTAQTFADEHVTGSLYITGSSVTVEDVRVDGAIFINSTPGGSYVTPVPADVTLRRVSGHNLYTLGFTRLTLDSIDLADTRDAPHAQIYSYYDPHTKTEYPADGLVLENSWLHGVLPTQKPSHMENLHIGGVHGARIEHNVFDFTAPNAATRQSITANVTLDTTQGGRFNSDIVLSDNVFRGGSFYQLYFAAVGHNEVTGNRFSSDSGIFKSVQFPPGGYPAKDRPSGGFPAFVQRGNTLDGKPVTLPGGN